MPEMVNAGTRMWDEHPDWVLHQPAAGPSPAATSMYWTIPTPTWWTSSTAVWRRCWTALPVSYIKWDMNRSISDAFSCAAGPAGQGEVLHRYILGLYRLYDRLTSRFPQILFESCASGGARFDPGMLYYAPQCWTSDDTDAVERLKIQYGTSFVYPISSMGGPCGGRPQPPAESYHLPDHQGQCGLFGAFGYELDLTQLSPRGRELVARQVDFFKRHRQLLQFGTFWRLQSPFTHNEAAWMTVSPDQTTALVGDYLILQQVNAGYRRIRLAGLDPSQLYRVTPLGSGAEPCGQPYTAGGDELMQAGLVTTGDSQAQHEGDLSPACTGWKPWKNKMDVLLEKFRFCAIQQTRRSVFVKMSKLKASQ